MKHIPKIIFCLILFGLFIAAGLLWQTYGEVLSAKSLPEIISQGSGGKINPSGQDIGLPQIPGETAERKIDRASLALINIILYVCGTAAGVMIIVGGIRYIISAGSDDAMKAAKSTILWACGGLVMTLLAWAIVINVVRIGSTEQRLDYSEDITGGSCGENITFGCKDVCCGCSSSGDGVGGCNSGLQCGGPLDVAIFEGIKEIRDTIRVCQPAPASTTQSSE